MDAMHTFDVHYHLYGAYFCSVGKLGWRTVLAMAVLLRVAGRNEEDTLRNGVVDVLATMSGWLLANTVRE